MGEQVIVTASHISRAFTGLPKPGQNEGITAPISGTIA
jgi:hypothetical protein